MKLFQPTGKTLFLLQVIAHLSIIPMILYATWWQWLIAIFVYCINAITLTITFHRLSTHRSWNPPKWIERILIVISTIGLASSALSWAATHKKHHRYEDSPNDPHSPTHKGFLGVWGVQLVDPEMKYVTYLLRNRLYTWQHEYYMLLVLVYAVILCIFSPFAIIYAFLVPAAACWSVVACLSYFTHTNAKIKNISIFNVLLLGEGYHKNHHTNPNSYSFGKYDMGKYIIRLLGSPKDDN